MQDAYDTREEAQSDGDFIREQAMRDWIEKPLSVEVVPETRELRGSKQSLTRFANSAMVTARWNWYQRHREQLTRWRSPRRCKLLAHKLVTPEAPTALFADRIGGQAVLPERTPWPTFMIDLWQDGAKRPKKKEVFGTYVGTFDLGGWFSFDESFPAAISIFLCTYNERRNEYCEWANCYQTVGAIVPLFAGDQLTSPPRPQGVVEIPSESVTAWELPDFPPYDEHGTCEIPPETETIFAEIGAAEPGTGSWINIRGNKVGGYPWFIQNNVLRQTIRGKPVREWHFIAMYCGGEVYMGDSGILYILAGQHKKTGEWLWHCEWDCH